jgi:hypothetical protein
MVKKYIPRLGDTVFVERCGFVRYVVVAVNEKNHTVTVKSVSGGTVAFTDNIPWGKLSPLDESQNDGRIEREYTKNK